MTPERKRSFCHLATAALFVLTVAAAAPERSTAADMHGHAQTEESIDTGEGNGIANA